MNYFISSLSPYFLGSYTKKNLSYVSVSLVQLLQDFQLSARCPPSTISFLGRGILQVKTASTVSHSVSTQLSLLPLSSLWSNTNYRGFPECRTEPLHFSEGCRNGAALFQQTRDLEENYCLIMNKMKLKRKNSYQKQKKDFMQ